MQEFISYEELIKSTVWQEKIEDLNAHLTQSIIDGGQQPILNGNLFYGHRKPVPPGEPYVEEFEEKRRNFFKLAKRSTKLFEIGVNGGHSMLLALMANPKLHAIGLDVNKKLAANWAPVHIYGPAAFAWLKANFGDRLELIEGNSLIEGPRYAIEHPDANIDLLHLDGSKDTHLREFLALESALASNAIIIHDDGNLGPVRRADRQLRKIQKTKILDLEAEGLKETVWQTLRWKA